jgi:ATP-dependent RNA helicase RhlE
VGRTARAELTGEAFTFAAPDEADDLRAIERAIEKPLLRVTLPDFDYPAKATAQLEVPRGERIAQIRARRAEERARAKAKAERAAAPPPPRAAGSGRRRRRRSR